MIQPLLQAREKGCSKFRWSENFFFFFRDLLTFSYEEKFKWSKKGAKCGHYLKLLALVLMRYASRDSCDISKAASSTKAHEPLLHNSLRFFYYWYIFPLNKSLNFNAHSIYAWFWKKVTSCMTSNVMKLSNGSRFQLEFISKHAKIILLVAFTLKNRNLLLLYSHKETKRLWFKFFIIIHCEITHKKEYLSICARNWSLNMHSHKIDSLHFISTYTLNSRGGGAIWDVPQIFIGTLSNILQWKW